MKDLTDQQFYATVRRVLEDYEISDIDIKLKKGELHSILDATSNLFAFNTWTSNHIDSILPQQAISNKNLDAFIKSQISHIKTVMDFCNFQYLDKRTFFRLDSIRFVLHIFLINKQFLIEKLHNITFEYWTNPTHYKNPFELIRSSFLDVIDIELFFKEHSSDFSLYKEDFAENFLKMQTFFYAFNITEKRIKTSFSIDVYQALCNLSLSKYKTKEITDTIMHHLDIDATINLRKIDNVHCIGKINFHKIYGYEPPLIPIKFIDRNSIKNLQQSQYENALENSDDALAETLDEMIKRFSNMLFL